MNVQKNVRDRSHASKACSFMCILYICDFLYQVSHNNFPLDEVHPSPNGTFFPVYTGRSKLNYIIFDNRTMRLKINPTLPNLLYLFNNLYSAKEV